MLLSYLFLSLATIAAAIPFPVRRTLDACSQANTPPCSCPAGTTFQQSTTMWLMNADVTDVMSIMGSYQNTSWFLHTPDYVTGPDNTIGSSRTLTGGTPAGTAQFTEALFDYSSSSDGFEMSYYLENGPITYIDPVTSLPGAYAGYWDILTVDRVITGKTFIKWAIYLCMTTDEEDNIQSFRESALTNVDDILQDQGLSNGFALGPWTVLYFIG